MLLIIAIIPAECVTKFLFFASMQPNILAICCPFVCVNFLIKVQLFFRDLVGVAYLKINYSITNGPEHEPCTDIFLYVRKLG